MDGGSSSTEGERALMSSKSSESSDSNPGPSQAPTTPQDQPQTVIVESLSSEHPFLERDPSGAFGQQRHQEEVHEINNIEFHRKYQVTGELKTGGYAVVYNGIRKEDNLPVAIKRIQSGNTARTRVMVNETLTLVPLEVAMLIRLGAGPGQEDNNVTPFLLDWYDLGCVIVMVMENPQPCKDLVEYINGFEGHITEHEAKMIFRQLVDAAISMLALGVFHRDIKPDNILIEISQPTPRARFIDFGCAEICSPSDIFQTPQGTSIYTSPEYYTMRRYRPDSTTVWQLGLTLYGMLHCRLPFASVQITCSSYQPSIRSDLSDDCKDFLRRLIDRNPETRMSLDSIKDHPWMN